jgi:hypothetical protein
MALADFSANPLHTAQRSRNQTYRTGADRENGEPSVLSVSSCSTVFEPRPSRAEWCFTAARRTAIGYLLSAIGYALHRRRRRLQLVEAIPELLAALVEVVEQGLHPLISIDPFRIGQDFVIISNQFSDRFREIRK